jgi:hypothetical protein
MLLLLPEPAAAAIAAPRDAAAVIAPSSMRKPRCMARDLNAPASLGGMGGSSTDEGQPVQQQRHNSTL